MAASDLFGGVEVGNGSGKAHDAVIPSPGQPQFIGGLVEQRPSFGIRCRDGFQQIPLKRGIDTGPDAGVPKPGGLSVAGAGDTQGDGGAWLAFRG